MSLAQDKQTILDAMAYRSGESLINTVYLGSLATAGLYATLGIAYGRSDFKAALEKADQKTVDKLLEQCQSIISYMRKYPTKKCPHCGQIMPERPKS